MTYYENLTNKPSSIRLPCWHYFGASRNPSSPKNVCWIERPCTFLDMVCDRRMKQTIPQEKNTPTPGNNRSYSSLGQVKRDAWKSYRNRKDCLTTGGNDWVLFARGKVNHSIPHIRLAYSWSTSATAFLKSKVKKKKRRPFPTLGRNAYWVANLTRNFFGGSLK